MRGAGLLHRAGFVFLLFLPMAAIGTLSHELGHYLVARAIGLDAAIHYGSTSWGGEAWDVLRRHRVLIIAGGPASTIAIGTIGLAWLFWLRARVDPTEPLGARGWIATLLALFWSREVFNALGLVAAALLLPEAQGGDEWELAGHWGVSSWLTVGIPFVLGATACVLVVFRLHPVGQRLALAIAGPAGAIAGFVIWYGALGPWLLP